MEPVLERDEIKYNNLLNVVKPKDFIAESYSSHNLTSKIFAAFKEIYSSQNTYDWYIKVDYDTFVLVDNLRLFLSSKNPFKPVTYGYDFVIWMPIRPGGSPEYLVYQTGGAGYVLSKEALNRLGNKLITDEKSCINMGYEDLDTFRCLKQVSVFAEKSIDELGRERFHQDSLWYYNTNVSHVRANEWEIGPANGVRTGPDCCSDTSISFHMMNIKRQEFFADVVRNNKYNKKAGYNFSRIYEASKKYRNDLF